MRYAHGFTLVEALLCCAIVAVLAAIGFPVLARAVTAAREARAIGNTGALLGAQATFYASAHRFALPDELVTRGIIATDQFERALPVGGSAAETLSDGTYDYSFRYALGAQGVTIDADPRLRFRALYRRFRIRSGRNAAGRGGGEGALLYAQPTSASPVSSAYRVLGT